MIKRTGWTLSFDGKRNVIFTLLLLLYVLWPLDLIKGHKDNTKSTMPFYKRELKISEDISSYMLILLRKLKYHMFAPRYCGYTKSQKGLPGKGNFFFQIEQDPVATKNIKKRPLQPSTSSFRFQQLQHNDQKNNTNRFNRNTSS